MEPENTPLNADNNTGAPPMTEEETKRHRGAKQQVFWFWILGSIGAYFLGIAFEEGSLRSLTYIVYSPMALIFFFVQAFIMRQFVPYLSPQLDKFKQVFLIGSGIYFTAVIIAMAAPLQDIGAGGTPISSPTTGLITSIAAVVAAATWIGMVAIESALQANSAKAKDS